MMMKFKYYIYYLRDEDGGYNLYAYTDRKYLAKMFERQRNMDKFKVKIKDLTKEDVHNMAYDYRTLMLDIIDITFYDDELNKKYKVDYALTTGEKLEFIHKCTAVSLKVYNNVWTSPLIFNKEIQKALFTLNYYTYHLYIAYSLDDKAYEKMNKKIVTNIKAICEDGGFFPANQEDSYFKFYVESVLEKNKEMEDALEVDQLAVLIKCIKDTM